MRTALLVSVGAATGQLVDPALTSVIADRQGGLALGLRCSVWHCWSRCWGHSQAGGRSQESGA